VGSHQRGLEGQNPLPESADHASFGAAQNKVDLLGFECTLLSHVELRSTNSPKFFLVGMLSIPSSTSLY